jgi:uncharacterized membrane protein YraQ (UPF0718 family)
MDKLKMIINRYKIFIIITIINIIVAVIYPNIGSKSFELTKNNALEMLSIIPPIFILLGLLDVWVKRETMVKYMGEGSGIRGALIAYALGSAAAGPLYAAFPVAVILLKKGSKLSNVLILIGAWSTTKIPLILFEASSMGVKFTAIRFTLNIFGIAVIAYTTEKFLTKEEKKDIYTRASQME